MSGTSLTVGMLKQCDDIQSHTQIRHQSITTAQISNALNRTKSKFSGKVEADGITPDLTCKAEDEITSGMEGKRRKYQGSSAGNESGILTALKNVDRISAENTESVQLAISRVLRETDNYIICQYKSSKGSKSSKRFKSRKNFTFSKCSKFRKRPKSLKPF